MSESELGTLRRAEDQGISEAAFAMEQLTEVIATSARLQHQLFPETPHATEGSESNSIDGEQIGGQIARFFDRFVVAVVCAEGLSVEFSDLSGRSEYFVDFGQVTNGLAAALADRRIPFDRSEDDLAAVEKLFGDKISRNTTYSFRRREYFRSTIRFVRDLQASEIDLASEQFGEAALSLTRPLPQLTEWLYQRMVIGYAEAINWAHAEEPVREIGVDAAQPPSPQQAMGVQLVRDAGPLRRGLQHFAPRIVETGVGGAGSSEPIWKRFQEEFTAYAKFKSALLGELGEGCHFIPLIGHGLSQRAGVITPQHNFPYLIYSIWCCVGDHPDGVDRSLAAKGYPAFPKDKDLLPALQWIRNVIELPSPPDNDELIRRLRELVDGNTSKLDLENTRQRRVWNVQGDWAKALHLLCCLYQPATKEMGQEAGALRKKLGIKEGIEPGPWHRRAMDGYNIFASRGVRPGLAHHMLAYLARPLSIHTTFTTNADDLVEQAFRKVRLNLRSFDVRGKGDLPGLDQVRAQDSIIRLNHLFSEDPDTTAPSGDPPSEEPEREKEIRETDKKRDEMEREQSNYRRFYQYLYPGFSEPDLNRKSPQKNIFTPPGRLLVLGFQPKYPRILEFIEFVLKHVKRVRKQNEIRKVRILADEIRGQLSECGGSIFRTERRSVHSFIKKLRTHFVSPGKLKTKFKSDEAEELFDDIDEFIRCFEKAQRARLDDLDEVVMTAKFRNDLAELYPRLQQRLTEQLQNIEGGDVFWNGYNKILKGFQGKTFFKLFVWPTVLAEAFVAAMRYLRNEGLACEWAIANFKIFWVSSTPDEKDLLKKHFGENFEEEHRDVFHFAQTGRPDILLYEVYQEATLCLPPGGITYQFVHMLPPDPPPLLELESGDHGTPRDPSATGFSDARLLLPEFDECYAQLRHALEQKKPSPGKIWAHTTSFLITELDAGKLARNNNGRLLVTYGGRGLSSVVSLAVKDRLDELIWFEIADHATPAITYHDVLTVIAYRTGRLQREHVGFAYPEAEKSGNPAKPPNNRASDEESVALLRERLGIPTRDWIIVFYGRNLPGANGRWDECGCWQEKDYKVFEQVLGELASLGLTILYLPLRASRADDLSDRLAAKFSAKSPPVAASGKSETQKPSLSFVHDVQIQDRVLDLEHLKDHRVEINSGYDPGEPAKDRWHPVQGLSSGHIFRHLRDWIESGDPSHWESGDRSRDRLRFLHILTLFRHSRHFSALCSEAAAPNILQFESSLGDDRDLARAVNVRVWIEDLYNIGLLRRKNGGFAWMHWSLRVYLQRCLEENIFPNGAPLVELLQIEDPNERRRLKIDLPARWLGNGVHSGIPDDDVDEDEDEVDNHRGAVPDPGLDDDDDDERNQTQKRGIRGWRARSHHWVADWYFKAFLASRHPLPLQECLHHHLQTIRNLPMAELPSRVKEIRGNASASLKAYKVQLLRNSLLGIARMLKLALPTIQFWMDEEVGGFFKVDQEVADESRDGVAEPDSGQGPVAPSPPQIGNLPRLVDLMKSSGTGDRDEVSLAALWPLLPDSEAADFSKQLSALIGSADALPICDLIKRQCNVIYQILQDDRGQRLFYGREPDDEVAHRLQWRSFSGSESLYFRPALTATIDEDLADVFVALVTEMKSTIRQAIAITGRIENEETRDSALDKILRHLENERPKEEQGQQAGEKIKPNGSIKQRLAKIGWRKVKKEAEALRPFRRYPRIRFDHSEKVHTHLGDWLARTSQLSDDHCKARKKELVRKCKSSVGFLEKDWERKDAGLEGADKKAPSRADFLELNENLADLLVEQFPLRRRDETREMLKLVSSCAHLHAREANLRESIVHAKIRASRKIRGKKKIPVSRKIQQSLKIDTVKETGLVVSQWIHVCRLCSCAGRLSHHLFPAQSDFLIRETVAIRSLYSNALAHLRRFTEAHRKLDEAFAYLFNSRYAVHDAHWGILALRRAEVCLYEALDGFSVYNGVDSTFRRRLSKLDDAWAGIERAQRWLGGTNQSNWWWGRLHTIKLRVLAAVEELDYEARKGRKRQSSKGEFFSLTQRSRIERFKQIEDVLNQVRLMVPADKLRMARAIDSVSLIAEFRVAFARRPEEESDTAKWKDLLEHCTRLFDQFVGMIPNQKNPDLMVKYTSLLREQVYLRAGMEPELTNDFEPDPDQPVAKEPESIEEIPNKDEIAPPTEEISDGDKIAEPVREPPIVFISYSHDSESHRNRVLGLAQRLRKDGIRATMDRFVEDGSPAEGWPRWMMNQMEQADHVLCICTEAYHRRFRGHEEPGTGKGVSWEGLIITQALYDKPEFATKFIPVVFEDTDKKHIPAPLRSSTIYLVDQAKKQTYDALYDAILGQRGIKPGTLGELKLKSREQCEPMVFDDER